MQNKRVLIIIYDKYLLQFILLRESKSRVSVIASKKLRVYSHLYNFSISDYILQSLTLWQEDIDIGLVEELVPIIPQVGKDGVSDIFVFTFLKDESLQSLSRDSFLLTKDIKQEGVGVLAKLLNFRNLLSISFDEDKTMVTRYTRGERGVMKVVCESKRFDIGNYASSEKFLANLEKFSDFIKKQKASNFLANTSHVPAFSLHSLQEVLLEYLVTISRLKPFVGCEKLEVSEFGKDEFADNLLVIGGERVRTVGNFSLFLLATTTIFDLKGNSSIYLDKFGFFDFLQKGGKQIFKDKFYHSILLELWGSFLRVEARKGAKLDEIVADVDVKDEGGEKQVIPMYGKIHKVSLQGKGDIDFIFKDRFFVDKKGGDLHLKDISGNFVIDSRAQPIERNFDLKSEAELVKSWLTGMEVISE